MSTAICIASPNLDAYSETFIRAHIERLPARVRVLYGGTTPRFSDSGSSLLNEGRIHQLLRRGFCEVLQLDRDYFYRKPIASFLRRTRTRCLLAEYGPTGIAVLDACRDARVPLVVHFHGFDANRKSALERYGSRYKELFNYASATIAVSKDMMQQLVALGAKPEKLHYNPCGADITLFGQAAPREAGPHFIAVGRFVDVKAPHLTLLAFHRVVQEVPDARLSMFGDGPLLEPCYQMAKSLHLLSSVEFGGAVGHLQVAEAMRQSRAFVQHSAAASDVVGEGTPVAVLEAGASGLPVVATRNGGIKDVVVNGETGFLVDECDVDSMADKMVLLARNPDLAGRMGKSAREHVRSKYSLDISITNLWRIIESVISTR